MNRFKPAIKLIAECFIISLIIALVDFGIIYLLFRNSTMVGYYASLALLLEGGLGLLAGGVLTSFARLFGKIGEKLFKSKPLDATSQKDAEGKAIPWIVTGVFLIFLGFIVSAF
jgi:hypothetical protein